MSTFVSGGSDPLYQYEELIAQIKQDTEIQAMFKKMIKESIQELLKDDGTNPNGVFSP